MSENIISIRAAFFQRARALLLQPDGGPIARAWSAMTNIERENWLIVGGATASHVTRLSNTQWTNLPNLNQQQIRTALIAASRRAIAIVESA